ncbi:envelope stress sensor histidine kinase BaeS [Mangrovibacter yixingensis]|uniref:envelope stress sensor histidine kinase BaeS n=1 Tax=Mangrovibacter yixingensis TaxID=1529639 RepID=UPI001CFC115B|nr:two-component system sensor histidine kinase BaeS [Mangrovibacter yixingensis]
MKFWRLGITGKLFVAILSTCILLLITMHWAVRVSFERGFIDYIKHGNQQRLVLLRDTLAEQYAIHGNWRFLRHNDRFMFQLLRSFDRDLAGAPMPPPRAGERNMEQYIPESEGKDQDDMADNDPSGMDHGQPDPFAPNSEPPQEDNGGPNGPGMDPLHGWRTQFWVLDQKSRLLVGPPFPIPPDSNREPIKFNDTTVGWVVASPVERLTRTTDISFDRQQRRTSWLIVALATLMAAGATFPLARGLLAPVKRLVDGTHKLAAGDFSTRVEQSSNDELGRLASDFNQLASTLEKNQQMRQAFMADISHELRTPLAVLRGELEAIQDGVRKFTPESVASLQAEVGTLTKLVNDLHQLSMSDQGALAYQRRHIEVISLVEMAAGAFRERFNSHGLTIDLSLPDNAMLFGDPDRLMQLFNNLLENSLRYTDSGGGLSINGRIQDRILHLQFADSGPGVTDEQLAQLFERFYRAEGSRNRASGGSGLGLSICQNIVEAHGGKISVGHAAAGGISIDVTLPLESETQRSV